MKLLHKYPTIMPRLQVLAAREVHLILPQVDKGAIKFILSGANIMCPGELLLYYGARLMLPRRSDIARRTHGR